MRKYILFIIILNVGISLEAAETATTPNTPVRKRKLTENGLLIISGGYRHPRRPGEYRTQMTREDQAKSDAACKKIYHRYGREDYKSLRDELLKKEAEFTSPGEFVAAVIIFHEARDKDSLAKDLAGLNPKIIKDSNTWHRIDNIISGDGMKAYLAFIKASEPKIYCPCNFRTYENQCIELLRSGKADKGERAALEKMVDMEPEFFARFCKLLGRDEKVCMKTINTELAGGKKSAADRRKNIDRMMSFVSYYKNSDEFNPELKRFVSLLDRNNELEAFNYIAAAALLKMYNEAADLLIRRIDLPVSDYEMEMAGAFCQMLMSKKEKYKRAVENRRGQLIDFLLKAKRAKEAQAWAEKFYGPNADPVKIRLSSWNRIGMVQMASDARVFEKNLQKAEPQAGTWEFYLRKYMYYLGRKDDKKVLDTLHEAIAKGKKLKNHELVIFASCRLADYYRRKGEKEKALEIARENNAYAVENVRSGQEIARKAGYFKGSRERMEAANQLMNILKEMKISGWEKEWEKVARREFLDGQTSLLRGFLRQKRCEDKNYTMSADDEIFETLCSEEYQKKHGFCDEAQAVRLGAVPYKNFWGGDFEACLKQALDDFEKYKRYKDSKPCSLRTAPFYEDPHRKERRAILAKYLFDRYPEAFKYDLVTSLPARTYKEGKALLEKYWGSGKLQAYERRRGLISLLEKAPDRTERQWCEKELAKFGPSSQSSR
jgi:hypothetical protein